jgi:small subunit ribosomal protein S20
LPQRRSGIKALRLNQRRTLKNLDIKTALKKTIKKYLAAVNTKNKPEAESALKIVYKKIDKAAKRHILHPKTAARRKSRFSRLLAKLN